MIVVYPESLLKERLLYLLIAPNKWSTQRPLILIT